VTRDELLAVSREPNVRALLDVIAACEGTAGKDGYRTQFGGGTFESLADHPRQVIERTMGGKPIASSAAGRYQFLGRTWASVAEQYGLPSFEPQWQDAGAVALIIGRGALEDIRAGRLDAATAKLNREWASLPGAPYGQPTKHPSFVRDVYLRAGGRLDGGAPIEARTAPTPPAAPAATQEQRSMAPVLAALLPSLISAIPQLAKLFGTGSAVSDRNIKAAETVAQIVVEATGAPNLQGAVEAIQADPAARQQATSAVEAAWFQLVEAGGGGIDGARKFNVAAAEIAAWRMPAVWITVALLLPVYATVGSVLWGEGWSNEIRLQVVTAVLVVISVVSAYWLGSSSGSQRKTDMLADK
jgi:muramidase (phage lysozyme)